MSAAPFSYRLGRLLALRVRWESDAALAYAESCARAAAIRDVQVELEARRGAVREGLMPATGDTHSVATSHLRTLLLAELDARAVTTSCALAAAETECEEKQLALNLRLRERRVLEKLRDRQQIDAKAESARLDRIAMDEVAQRHTALNARPTRGI